MAGGATAPSRRGPSVGGAHEVGSTTLATTTCPLGDPMPTDALSSKQPTAQVTVLIADDAATVRRALGQLLADDPRFALVAVAGDGDEAAALAADRRPQLAVLDVRMGGGGGPSAAERIRTASPDTIVVALSALDTPSSRRR